MVVLSEELKPEIEQDTEQDAARPLLKPNTKVFISSTSSMQDYKFYWSHEPQLNVFDVL